jgi:hypothetical protein
VRAFARSPSSLRGARRWISPDPVTAAHGFIVRSQVRRRPRAHKSKRVLEPHKVDGAFASFEPQEASCSHGRERDIGRSAGDGAGTALGAMRSSWQQVTAQRGRRMPKYLSIRPLWPYGAATACGRVRLIPHPRSLGAIWLVSGRTRTAAPSAV